MAQRTRWVPRRTVLSLALYPSIWSCSKKQAAPERPTVSLIMKSLANEFFRTMADAARLHQRAHTQRYELVESGIDDERDVERQIALVERAIKQGVEAIVLAPADSKALVPTCKRALDAKIVVVNIDNKLDATVLAEKNFSIPFIGPDNRKGARLAGQCLAKALRPGDAVAIIEGVAGAYNGVQRRLGFEDAMKAAGMRIVASVSASWETEQAARVTGELLSRHADLRGILAANDSMALGAAASLAEAGKTEQIKLIGFDNTSAARELMKKGRLLATVDQHEEQLATFGIEFALDILSNRAIPADRETPVDLVTAETLAQSN